MAKLLEWEDEYKDGAFKLSVLWLVENEMAVVVTGSNIFAKNGCYTVMCPQLCIQHEGLSSTTLENAKVEAINVLASRLTKYGNGLRAFMAKNKVCETKNNEPNGRE